MWYFAHPLRAAVLLATSVGQLVLVPSGSYSLAWVHETMSSMEWLPEVMRLSLSCPFDDDDRWRRLSLTVASMRHIT